ncbi:MAG: hypothetical protein ACFFHV_20265 [Promethearchaeota archaeon]
MKQKIKYTLFLGLLIFCLFISMIPIGTSTPTDLDYTFQEDVLVDTQTTNFNTVFNMNNNSNVFTPDKFEFTFEKDGSMFTSGDEITTDVYTWSEIDDANDWVNILYPIDEYNGVARLYSDSGTYYGIEKDNFDTYIPSGQNFNVTFRLMFVGTGGLTSVTNIRFYDSASDQITIFRMTRDSLKMMDVDYYDGAWHDLLEMYGLTPVKWMNLNFHARHDKIFLRYWMDGILNDTTYSFDMQNNAVGLDYVKIETKLNEVSIYVDNIGVYSKNVSIVQKEHAYIYDSFGFHKYRFNQYPYYTFVTPFTENISQMYICEHQRLRFNSIKRDVRPKTNFTGFINNQEISIVGGAGKFPSLIMITNNTINMNLINFTIEGITLFEGVNEYYPNLSFGNVNINQSYFWVDGTRLRYNISYDDIDVYEWLSISFDITDTLCYNRSVETTTSFNGNGYATFYVNYTDNTLTPFELDPNPMEINVLLPEDKIVDGFFFQITNENSSSFINTTATGNIRYITLAFYPNYAVQFTVTGFVNVLIDVMLLFLPTLLLYVPFNKKDKKMGTIIFFGGLLIFAIIYLGGSIFPAWLFMLILFCLGLIFLRHRGDF